jgi:DNA-binding MarR family transcriptional regulator
MLVGHSLSDPNGLLLTMDQTVEDLLQRPLSELVGRSYADVTHPDDRVRNIDRVTMLAPGAGPVCIRKRYLHVSRLDRGLEAGRLVGTLYLPQAKALTAVPNVVMPERLWQVALKVDRSLHRRREQLGDDLFGDHAWLVLVQIYLAEAEGRMIDATTLGALALLDPSRTHRWIGALAEKGLVERPDCSAGVIQLTATGLARTETLLATYSDLA